MRHDQRRRLRSRARDSVLHPVGHELLVRARLFPSLLRDEIPFYAYVHRGYWIDIGTPEKYLRVHRDILAGVLPFEGFSPNAGGTFVDPKATVEGGATIQGPGYIGEGSVVKEGATLEPYAVLGPNCRVEAGATVGNSVLWSNVRIGSEARVRSALIGRSAHVGHHASVDGGIVLGDKSVLTDYSRITPLEAE